MAHQRDCTYIPRLNPLNAIPWKVSSMAFLLTKKHKSSMDPETFIKVRVKVGHLDSATCSVFKNNFNQFISM